MAYTRTIMIILLLSARFAIPLDHLILMRSTLQKPHAVCREYIQPSCLFNVPYFKTTQNEEKEEGLVPACAKVKADTSCVRKLGAHLEFISCCIALRILYAELEECC